MFHVKDDFEAGKPFTQVPASWFNKVASFINNLVGGNHIQVRKEEKSQSVIAFEGLLPSDSVGDAPANKTDAPDVLDTDGDEWTWNAGSGNGLYLDAYYRIGTTTNNYHLFQRCRLTISSSGLVVAAQGLPERIRIRA